MKNQIYNFQNKFIYSSVSGIIRCIKWIKPRET